MIVKVPLLDDARRAVEPVLRQRVASLPATAGEARVRLLQVCEQR
jgi:hypothetical protein